MNDKVRRIIKVKKDSSGNITNVMMENGDIYSVNDAVIMAKNNLIENMNIELAKSGRDYLTTGDFKNDNLNNLPTF